MFANIPVDTFAMPMDEETRAGFSELIKGRYVLIGGDIIDNDHVLRGLVGDELAQVAKEFGTPRRTVLLASSGAPTAAKAIRQIEAWRDDV